MTFVTFGPDSTSVTIEGMPLQSLLVSRDAHVVGVLRPTLEELSINMEVCHGAKSGNEILLSQKFDGVIVDCDDLQGGLDILQSLRKGTSNKNSVAFAILNGSTTTQRAFELGANFVLQKPISPLNAMRCFSAAVGFMIRERRRYFRLPVNIPVLAIFGTDQQINATACNLSEGGMALFFKGEVPKTGLSRVTFTLPDVHAIIEPKADVAWADGSGKAGIRFTEMPANCRQELDAWLEQQIEQVDPLAPA